MHAKRQSREGMKHRGPDPRSSQSKWTRNTMSQRMKKRRNTIAGVHTRAAIRTAQISDVRRARKIQWPRRFDPVVLPQFDGESDPKEFLLKYEAAIEAIKGDSACKSKVLVLILRGLAHH